MTDKACTKCDVVQPVSAFVKDASKPDGLHPWCRSCRSERQRAYDAGRRAERRQYYEANREQVLESVRRYREENRERYVALKRQAYLSHRDAVLDHYGRACACCGSTEQLNIDHVNGGGEEHRRDVGRGGAFYAWLIRSDFPRGYQTLCFPCNRSKDSGSRCRLSHGGGAA